MFSHVTFQNSKEKWVAYLETIYSSPIIFLFYFHIVYGVHFSNSMAKENYKWSCL